MAGDNQSITIEILEDNDDTRFFTEVHLLADKLVPVVAIHLEVHALIGITRLTRNRVPHSQHKIWIHKL